eukprot:580494-Rhodomonas_salina.1
MKRTREDGCHPTLSSYALPTKGRILTWACHALSSYEMPGTDTDSRPVLMCAMLLGLCSYGNDMAGTDVGYAAIRTVEELHKTVQRFVPCLFCTASSAELRTVSVFVLSVQSIVLCTRRCQEYIKNTETPEWEMFE